MENKDFTKENNIMKMDLQTRNLYCYALNMVTQPLDVTKRQDLPLGLIHALSEVEDNGNYEPLREQESTIREFALRY